MPVSLARSVSSGYTPMRRLIHAAVLVVLAGCANPIVRMDLAGYSLKASPAPVGEPTSMAQAIAKLNHARAAYNEAILSQTGTSQNAITGLVWLGAVMLGAASSVHKDVLVTTGVIGGTTYGLTVAQLDKRRIDVWQAGIDTLDCARAAIVPLEIGDTERDRVRDGLKTLRNKMSEADAAREKLTSNLGTREVTAEDEPKIKVLLAAAEEQLKQAKKTQDAGDFLLRASRGSELSVAVNNISSKVNEVMGNVALPVTAVKDILAALPGQIAMLVPGGQPKGTTPTGDGKPKAESSSVVARDFTSLTDALKNLAAAQLDVNNLLIAPNASVAIAALKDCKLANVFKPFELMPPANSFIQGRAQATGFEIRGGLPYYRVKPLNALPEGISMEFEGGDANTVKLNISDKAQPTEARFLVSDRSNPPQTQQFVLKVEPAPTTTPTPAPAVAVKETVNTPVAKTPPKPAKGASAPAVKPAPAAPAPVPSASAPAPSPGSAASAPTSAPKATPQVLPSDPVAVEAAWKELQAALAAPGFSRSLSGVTLSVESTQLKAGRLFVKLKCSKPDAGLAAIGVREDLAAAAPQAKDALIKNNALDAKLQQIDLSRSKPCIKD